jgi:hypothetical protein
MNESFRSKGEIMAFTLRLSQKPVIDFEGNTGNPFTLTVEPPQAGSLRLMSATYNGVTNPGPKVSFAVAAGTNALAVVLAFARDGETGFLVETDTSGQTQQLKKIVTRTSFDRVYFVEGL